MSLPVRFTVCSYNIWGTTRWLERKTALESFVKHHIPDILCLQELQADSRHALDQVLSETHARVDDSFGGWESEGNVYWNTQFFELINYGAEAIGQLEEFRRLFWVRLRLRDARAITLFVSNAHYTWPGNPEETTTGLNLRILQAQKTIEVFDRLSPLAEPLLFMGDLNDQLHPISILRKSGLTDCFTALGQTPRPTYPAFAGAESTTPFTIDWLFHRGSIRPMNVQVVDFYYGDLAPSDHKPVLATFELI